MNVNAKVHSISYDFSSIGVMRMGKQNKEEKVLIKYRIWVRLIINVNPKTVNKKIYLDK